MSEDTRAKGDIFHCSIPECIGLLSAELKWPRKKTWERAELIANRRGLPVVSYIVTPPGGRELLHCVLIITLKGDQGHTWFSEWLRIFREEYPGVGGAKRGPKGKYADAWPRVQAYVEAVWAENGRIGESLADDARLLIEWFNARNLDEPSWTRAQEKAGAWRKAYGR